MWYWFKINTKSQAVIAFFTNSKHPNFALKSDICELRSYLEYMEAFLVLCAQTRHFISFLLTRRVNWSVIIFLPLYNRPRDKKEIKEGSGVVVECQPQKKEVLVKQDTSYGNQTTKTFIFDRVFGPDSKQIDVYRSVVVPILDEVLMGYNCTIFA